MSEGLSTENNSVVSLKNLKTLSVRDFQNRIFDGCRAGMRVSALFAGAREQGAGHRLVGILSNDHAGKLEILASELPAGVAIESLTTHLPQVHLFEREMHETHGIAITGHPALRPVRFIANCHSADYTDIGKMSFYAVDSQDSHEVAVGPVHAGVIEPGHFRFQCFGETVFNLEISLGYQHRGIEGQLCQGPNKRSFHYIETAAGDSTVAHTTAYCQLLESLADVQIPVRAMAIRGIALELERIANHVGDLGALAGDVGFLPTAAYCGRIRGDFLNMTAAICGNRFGRSLLCPGGVNFDITTELVRELTQKITVTFDELSSAVELLWSTGSVVTRFEGTGVISPENARNMGLVGVAARACGLEIDVRQDHPAEIFCYNHIPISIWHSGDVFARAYVRWLEIRRSVQFIRQQLAMLPGGEICRQLGPLQPDAACVALVEGWRGEICHTVMTDAQGNFRQYKIVDPSFHNWTGLAMALRNQQISDFPLCNKSFNLSYCGHDL